MDELEKARKTINKIDAEMADLFTQRMEAVKKVALYKKEKGLPILDKDREEKVLENNSKKVKNKELRAFYVEFLKETMSVSRAYQHYLINGSKIAYSGVEGAFANIAGTMLFPDGNLCPYPNFVEAYKAVESGECECCVLPIENSFAGEVGQVLDLLYEGSLFVNGVFALPIKQNLLVKKGGHIEDIKTVISHPQALAQCSSYIREHGFKEIKEVNTAVAAKRVAESKDKSIAAIASRQTAKLYNMKVLDHDINDDLSNTTRFAVISRSANKEAASKENNFILLFTVNNTAGSLASVIDIISKHKFNMSVLRSRPVKSKPWCYYFYAELEGSASSKEAKMMLEEIKKNCDKLKIVGSFKANQTIESIIEK